MTKKKAKSPASTSQEPKVDGRTLRGSITPEKAAVIIACLENNLNVKQSLIQAKVSQDAYDRKLKSSAAFREAVATAKEMPMILTKAGIMNKLKQEDGSMLRWFAERKAPEEFSPSFGDGDTPPGLPAGTVIVLPGAYPHPRIVPLPKNAKDS